MIREYKNGDSAEVKGLTVTVRLGEESMSEIREAVLDTINDALRDENAKLREFASEAFTMAFNFYHGAGTAEDLRWLKTKYRELGIEVGE